MSEQAAPTITFDEFKKLDIRIAKVIAASDHPNADKLIVINLDLGNEQRQIIAGLKPHYTPDALLGKNVVVVTNLQPRKMRGLESNAMLLAAVWDDAGSQQVSTIFADDKVPPGAAVT